MAEDVTTTADVADGVDWTTVADGVDTADGVETAKIVDVAELCDHVFQSHCDWDASGVHQTCDDVGQAVSADKNGMAESILPLLIGVPDTSVVKMAREVARILLVGDILDAEVRYLPLWSVVLKRMLWKSVSL